MTELLEVAETEALSQPEADAVAESQPLPEKLCELLPELLRRADALAELHGERLPAALEEREAQAVALPLSSGECDALSEAEAVTL